MKNERRVLVISRYDENLMKRKQYVAVFVWFLAFEFPSLSSFSGLLKKMDFKWKIQMDQLQWLLCGSLRNLCVCVCGMLVSSMFTIAHCARPRNLPDSDHTPFTLALALNFRIIFAFDFVLLSLSWINYLVFYWKLPFSIAYRNGEEYSVQSAALWLV